MPREENTAPPPKGCWPGWGQVGGGLIEGIEQLGWVLGDPFNFEWFNLTVSEALLTRILRQGRLNPDVL